jgi:hypothetical protein
MNPKELEKELRKKDKDVEVKKDDPTSFRIFIYSQMQRYPIISKVRKIKTLRILLISDYPKQKEHYPICVIRVERLRIQRKTKKGKETAKNSF